ncbi:hypothetical protein HK101_003764, partial [Irineochytrium annulatum]
MPTVLPPDPSPRAARPPAQPPPQDLSGEFTAADMANAVDVIASCIKNEAPHFANFDPEMIAAQHLEPTKGKKAVNTQLQMLLQRLKNPPPSDHVPSAWERADILNAQMSLDESMVTELIVTNWILPRLAHILRIFISTRPPNSQITFPALYKMLFGVASEDTATMERNIAYFTVKSKLRFYPVSAEPSNETFLEESKWVNQSFIGCYVKPTREWGVSPHSPAGQGFYLEKILHDEKVLAELKSEDDHCAWDSVAALQAFSPVFIKLWELDKPANADGYSPTLRAMTIIHTLNHIKPPDNVNHCRNLASSTNLYRYITLAAINIQVSQCPYAPARLCDAVASAFNIVLELMDPATTDAQTKQAISQL